MFIDWALRWTRALEAWFLGGFVAFCSRGASTCWYFSVNLIWPSLSHPERAFAERCIKYRLCPAGFRNCQSCSWEWHLGVSRAVSMESPAAVIVAVHGGSRSSPGPRGQNLLGPLRPRRACELTLKSGAKESATAAVLVEPQNSWEMDVWASQNVSIDIDAKSTLFLKVL